MVEPLPEALLCPHCRCEIEMFTNEVSYRCPHCGGLVVRERKPSCFDWCEYADKCAKELGIDLDGNRRKP